jgi:hypothetical protein
MVATGSKDSGENRRVRMRGGSERLFFIGGLIAFFDRRLEIANAFPESFAEVGEFAGAKDEKRNCQNDENFRKT